MKTGIELIAEERRRQIDELTWTSIHDDKHTDESLAFAAAAYALPDGVTLEGEYEGKRDELFPKDAWGFEWFKPARNDRIRELQKAGALIAAEIDRLQRKKYEK